jgi:rSAM/selenodomain-associated transferase 1
MSATNRLQAANGTRAVLCVMAKAPRPGHVKTRLTPHYDARSVAALYQCLLEDTLARARAVADIRVIVVCPPEDVGALTTLLPGISVTAQQGSGLSAGLRWVFAHFCTRGDHRVVALDSDSPHLPSGAIESAFASLRFNDLVIGPTTDGGYYLVGARAAHPALFRPDSVGTGAALDSLQDSARQLGLATALLEECYDIDLPGDVERLQADLGKWPERAPRTARLLREWRPAPILSTP